MIRVLVTLMVLSQTGGLLADELGIARSEIDNLGIVFAKPVPANESVGIRATARVTLPADADATVSATQDGLVASILVDVGDAVAEADVLAELQSPRFIELQRDLVEATNAHRVSTVTYERDVLLHKGGIIAERRLQETTARHAIATASLEEHRQLLRIAGMPEAEIRRLEEAQQIQAALKIRAPFAGVVAERFVSRGQRLDPMTPMFRIVDASELWLEIDVPEEQLAGIRPDDYVAVHGRSGGAAARVIAIGSTSDPATQSVTVRARVDGRPTGIRTGQFVDVNISTGGPALTTNTVFEVPATSVTRRGDSAYVFLRTDGGVKALPVDIVGGSGPTTLISGQVDADDTVAISGVAALKALWLAGNDETGE